MLTTGRFERLLGLLQAHGLPLGGGPDRAFRARHPRFAGRLHLFELLLASVAALWAARSLVAMGAETALISSCCTWNKSGEWCASR